MSSSGSWFLGDSSSSAYWPPTMDETGGLIPHLDPYAQEFCPTYPSPPDSAPVLLFPHHYYPYTSPPPVLPPLPPPPPPLYPLGVVVPASYLPTPNQPPLPPPLPPPSSTATRSLLLSSVPTDVSESTARRDLEVFGDVRAVQMERARREGIVAVHFYDLRASHAALTAICEQHMQQQHRLRVHYSGLMMMAAPGADAAGHGKLDNVAGFGVVPSSPPPPPAPGIVGGRAVWAQFMIPAINSFPDGHNQGTLVVFNLDPQISPSALRRLFEPYGPVKEFRETPMKRNQRFVEFYDVRDAAKALSAMNMKEINGRVVMIEFSRPGGHGKRSSFSSSSSPSSSSGRDHHRQYGIHKYYPLSGSRRNMSPSPRLSHPSSCSRGKSHWRSNVMANLPPRVKGWFSSRRSSDVGCKKNSNLKSNSNSNSSGGSSTTVDFSVDSALGGLTLRDDGDREEAKGRGNSGWTRKDTSDDGDRDETEGEVLRCMEAPPPATTRMKCSGRATKVRKNFDPRFLIKEGAIGVESSRSCSSTSCCSDTRTTVMIKNIPNKYSQKLLLNMLDNHCIHCNDLILAGADDDDGDHHVDPSTPLSSYDFLYLPIDFSNKCNVGYGFVNMTSPAATLRLYKAFHKQHWEVFNSRKICEVTYARVQGLEALKDHFKNSKFACEAEEYLPVVFSPPRDGKRNLTPPLPIVAHYTPTTTSQLAAVDDHEEEGADWGSTTSHYQEETRGDMDDDDGGGVDHNNERDDYQVEQDHAVEELTTKGLMN